MVVDRRLDEAVRQMRMMDLRRRRLPTRTFGTDPVWYGDFREIRLHGNKPGHVFSRVGPPRQIGERRPNLLRCRDGFVFSVIAGPGMYCRPRPELSLWEDEDWKPNPLSDVAIDYPGPYWEVEVGFYSGWLPRPWSTWREYAEQPCTPYLGRHLVHVFPYVPVALVYDLIRAHGGRWCR